MESAPSTIQSDDSSLFFIENCEDNNFSCSRVTFDVCLEQKKRFSIKCLGNENCKI